MIEYNNFRIGNEDSYFKLDQLGRVLLNADLLSDSADQSKDFWTQSRCVLWIDSRWNRPWKRNAWLRLQFWVKIFFKIRISNYLLFRIFNPAIEKRHEMIYLQRPTSGNIFRLLIMTMTPTQMGTVPTKMDLVGGSIDAVLPTSMLHITRMSIPHRNSWRNDYL